MKKLVFLLVLALTITSCGNSKISRKGYLATKENNSVVLVSTETGNTTVIRSEDYSSSAEQLNSLNINQGEFKDFVFSKKKRKFFENKESQESAWHIFLGGFIIGIIFLLFIFALFFSD